MPILLTDEPDAWRARLMEACYPTMGTSNECKPSIADIKQALLTLKRQDDEMIELRSLLQALKEVIVKVGSILEKVK